MPHKLLLADDSVTIQRVIELTFADEDVEVTAVGDGQLAIERLDADPPDIVLADVDMPKRDGYEVAAYVKSRPKLAHIPVVLLTGAFEPIDQARAAAAGSSDVLAKPFEPQMVINRVMELLGKKRPQDERDNYGAPQQPPLARPAPRQTLPLKGHSNGHPTVQSPRGGGPGAAAALGPMAPPPSGVPSHDNQMIGPGEANPMAQGQSSQPASLDDYFDQLDAAFSNLQPGAPRLQRDAMQSEEDWPILEPAPPAQGIASVSRGAATPAPVQPEWRPEPAAAMARPAPPSPPVPPTPPAYVPQSGTRASKSATPAFAPGASASAPGGAAADKSVGKPATPAAPHALHASVAPDARLALATPAAPHALATPAAPHAPVALVAPHAPVAPQTPVAAPLITEELVQQVAMRVLLRMSDRVVRETVSEIVSKTAERLVQEEIEKIKSGGE